MNSDTTVFFGPFAPLEELLGLIPPAYDAYRPLVGDALLFFLGSLPPDRLGTLLADQQAQPAGASCAQRLTALFRQCPTLHKLGQVVARDRRLDPELRQRLQSLESLPPCAPSPQVISVLRRLARKIPGLSVAPHVMAEASVAQIIPFVWESPSDQLPRDGVFKVLRPGVIRHLEEERAIWSRLAVYLEERCRFHRLPEFDYRSTLESVSRLLAHEIRLDQEQSHLSRAQQLYCDWPDLWIPRLYPFCTPHITAMERISGGKVTEVPASAPALRRCAHLVAEALLAFPFWESGSFHADPHAGNLMLAEDGRLAILDWALMTELSKPQCEALMQIIISALSLDNARLCCALTELGRVRHPQRLQAIAAEALSRVRFGLFPGFDWLTGLLDGLVAQSALQFPDELVLLRKALLTLQCVIADISGQASIDTVLLSSGAEHFFRHFWSRLTALPHSRDTGIHLSNRDLLDLWAGSPATALRFWFGNAV